MLAGIKAPGSTWRNVVFDTTDPTKAVRGGGCIEGAITDLSEADFTGASFTGMNWGNTIFDGATMPPVIESAAVLRVDGLILNIETSFEGASLKKARMAGIKISETGMTSADIRGADLRGTEFRDMKDMMDLAFDETTRLEGAKFINSVPPYALMKLKEKQERPSAPPPSPGP